MDAGTKQLADILNGNRVLEVPYYQRSYVWKEEQWERLLSINDSLQVVRRESTGLHPLL